MPYLDPAVAATRTAVRDALDGIPPGAPVLAAVSGGADSSALAAAVAFVAGRAGRPAGAVTVDHGWTADSSARARAVAGTCRRLGLDPVDVAVVDSPPGPDAERRARDARRAALSAAAGCLGAGAVLLAHTLDDQAETVLLGLARGSGARSLAGMRAVDGLWRRPFLGLTRAQTLAACAAQEMPVWQDPANADPRHARARVRADVIPALRAALGDGAVAGLARTADLLRADADLLERLAEEATPGVTDDDGSLDVAGLARLPAALRGRVLHRAARLAGCPPTALQRRHVQALDELVTRWHGQAAVSLPAGRCARRRGGRIHLGPAGAPPADGRAASGRGTR